MLQPGSRRVSLLGSHSCLFTLPLPKRSKSELFPHLTWSQRPYASPPTTALQPPPEEPFPTPYLGALQLPGDPGHDVHCISTPDSNADAPQATAIGGVGISANQKNPRVRVVFQNDLKKTRRSSA